MSAIQLFDLNGEQRFTGTSVGGESPLLKSLRVNLTTADILALTHSDVGAQQVFAPVAGLIRLPMLAIERFDPGGTPFAGGDSITLGPGPTANLWYDAVIAISELQGSAATVNTIDLAAVYASPGTPVGQFENIAWYLRLATDTPFTAGDGSATLDIFYVESQR